MQGQQGKQPKEQSLWIDAYKSVTNQLDTYANNVDLVDIDENGEQKLVVADFPGMITIYKGVNIDWQTQFPDSISAVSQFQGTFNKKKMSTILAVASDKYIYMYNQRQKYRRLNLHYIETDPNESDIWKSYNGDIDSMSTFLVALNDLKNSGVKLSPNSLNILMLETAEEQVQFYLQAKNVPNFMHDTATCMTNLYSHYNVPGSATQLVIGTELKWLIICNEVGSEFLHQFQLSETPFKMVTRGALSKDYSIYIIARNNKFIYFSNGETKKTIALESSPNDIALVEENVFLSYFTGMVQVYSQQGLPLRSISLTENIQGMANLYMEKLGHSKGLVVVGGCKLNLYDTSGVALLSSTKIEDEVVAVKFGKISREDCCLLLMYKNKGIEIKILNRRMIGTSDALKTTTTQKQGEDKPELKPPARSRIFAEQLEVDKDKAVNTYNSYQKDSVRLKILVDDNYLKLLDRGMISENKRVKIHADVEGMGPVFKVQLEFTNQGQKPLTGLALTLQFSSANYVLVDGLPEVKFLLPNIMLKMVFKIKNISTMGSNEDIKVYLFEQRDARPIAGASITMPVCDPTVNLN